MSSESSAKAQPKRLVSSVEGMRCWAAMAVVCHHVRHLNPDLWPFGEIKYVHRITGISERRLAVEGARGSAAETVGSADQWASDDVAAAVVDYDDAQNEDYIIVPCQAGEQSAECFSPMFDEAPAHEKTPASSQEPVVSRRRLRMYDFLTLSKTEYPFTTYFFGIGIGHVGVELFFVIAAFVSTVHAFEGHAAAMADGKLAPALAGNADSVGQREAVGRSILRRYQRSLLGRFFRLALPVIPVHIVHILLWRADLVVGIWLTRTPTEKVTDAYSIGLRAVWTDVMSQTLWILERLFFAAFAAVAIQTAVLGCRPRLRVPWYLLCTLYFYGDFWDRFTFNHMAPVPVGVGLADLFVNGGDTLDAWRRRWPAPFAVVVLAIGWGLTSAAWWPGAWYRQLQSMVVTSAGIMVLGLWGPRWHNLLLFDNCLYARLAKYTYSLYIWHLLVYLLFSTNLYPRTVPPHVPFSHTVADWKRGDIIASQMRAAGQEPEPAELSKLVLYLGAPAVVAVVTPITYWLLEVPLTNLASKFVVWLSEDP